MPNRLEMTEQAGSKARVAVVTGGARGIGEAVVAKFRSDGAKVVALIRSDPETPQPGVRYVKADISIEAEVRAAFADIDGVEGRVDVVVNNAGIQRLGLIGKLPSEDWDAVVGTNLTGAFLVSSEAARRMAGQDEGGAIVNIASTAAFLGMPGRGPYCAAKAGLLGLTRAMALEGATAGVRVNAVAPGFTRSEFIEERIADGALTEEWMLERVPMKRIAEPSEIADVVAAVASPAFSFVTGQTILVDGGWSIQGVSDAPEPLRGLS
jgi:NAD(P)-dependent dehydrogenase (short-subunit alcohol dehydrogenase family)